MTERERKDNELEIKAREELLRRMEYPRKLLEAAAEKEKAKRIELVEKSLGDYSTQNAIDEAWGYDMITEDEKRALEEALEKGESAILDQITPVEVAARILRDFCCRLASEAESFRFDNKSPEEQERIREEHRRLQEEIAKRKRGGINNEFTRRSERIPVPSARRDHERRPDG